ncbi:hypothetical protein [Candidatus Pyrohabitans sp.]
MVTVLDKAKEHFGAYYAGRTYDEYVTWVCTELGSGDASRQGQVAIRTAFLTILANRASGTGWQYQTKCEDFAKFGLAAIHDYTPKPNEIHFLLEYGGWALGYGVNTFGSTISVTQRDCLTESTHGIKENSGKIDARYCAETLDTWWRNHRTSNLPCKEYDYCNDIHRCGDTRVQVAGEVNTQDCPCIASPNRVSIGYLGIKSAQYFASVVYNDTEVGRLHQGLYNQQLDVGTRNTWENNGKDGAFYDGHCPSRGSAAWNISDAYVAMCCFGFWLREIAVGETTANSTAMDWLAKYVDANWASFDTSWRPVVMAAQYDLNGTLASRVSEGYDASSDTLGRPVTLGILLWRKQDANIF